MLIYDNILFFIERSYKTKKIRAVQPTGLFIKENENILILEEIIKAYRNNKQFNITVGIGDTREV